MQQTHTNIDDATKSYVESTLMLYQSNDDAPYELAHEFVEADDDSNSLKLETSEECHQLIVDTTDGSTVYAVWDESWIFDNTIQAFKTAQEAADFLIEYADFSWDNEYRDPDAGNKTLRELLDPTVKRLRERFLADPSKLDSMNTDDPNDDQQYHSVGENVRLCIAPVVKYARVRETIAA